MKWPVVDQCVAVSTVVRPVTVIAEVEVKSASKKLVAVPDFDETGNIRKKVPKSIRAVKAAAIICVEDSLGSFGISGKTILLGKYLADKLLPDGANSAQSCYCPIFYWGFRPDCDSHKSQSYFGERLNNPSGFCP